MSCAELYDNEIFKSIEKIKSNSILTTDEIEKLDDFFSKEENHIFLNTILSNNVIFDFELLRKTIISTFKNNFVCFRNICKKGVCPTIYAGYKPSRIHSVDYRFIKVGDEVKPFLWIDKKNLSLIMNNLSNIRFNLNLYYYLDSIVNVNELKRLKSHSNLTLVGENKCFYINLNNFSKQIVLIEEFEKNLK